METSSSVNSHTKSVNSHAKKSQRFVSFGSIILMRVCRACGRPFQGTRSIFSFGGAKSGERRRF